MKHLAVPGDSLRYKKRDCIFIYAAAIYIISHVPVQPSSSPGPPRPVPFIILDLSPSASMPNQSGELLEPPPVSRRARDDDGDVNVMEKRKSLNNFNNRARHE